MGGIGSRGGNVLGSCNFKWLRVAETAHPTTIARLIGRSVFGGMVRINFLRVEISTAHSSKLGLRYSSRQLCHCVMAGSVTRRIRVPACQMILAVLDHALHADNT
jgi:hypothetical protein